MPEKPDTATRLRELAAQIAELDINSLVQPRDAAPYDFKDGTELFENVKAFFKEVSTANLRFVPPSNLEQLKNSTETLLVKLIQIRDFNVQKFGDPKSQRNDFGRQASQAWHEAYNQIVSHLALATVSSTAIHEVVDSFQTKASASLKHCDKATGDCADKIKGADEKMQARMAELEKVMAAARQASAQAAVSAQAGIYEAEAGRYLIASRWWCGGAAIAVGLSILAIWCMFIKESHLASVIGPTAGVRTQIVSSNQPNIIAATTPSVADQTDSAIKGIPVKVVQQTVARILIVTLLYSAVVWCVRNFFACRHNFTVNRHRQNAMQTFRAFVEGTKDLATQDFILRQAAACAFAPQQTGYLKDESLPIPAPASQFIDSVKPTQN